MFVYNKLFLYDNNAYVGTTCYAAVNKGDSPRILNSLFMNITLAGVTLNKFKF